MNYQAKMLLGWPWRKVVTVQRVHSSWYHSSQKLTLECGHEQWIKGSARTPKKQRCAFCPREKATA